MFGYKKVGGLRFLRIGRLNVSWSLMRKPAPIYTFIHDLNK